MHKHIHIYICIYMYMYIDIYKHNHTYLCRPTHTYVYIWKHTHTHICIYIYKYICIHTYMLIYIYIYIHDFFVWALLLKIHTLNCSLLRSNLLRLQCTCFTVQTTSGKPHASLLVWACQSPSSQPLSSPQLSYNDNPWTYGITKSHREQGLDYREAEELSWCPSWSNSLWQGWSCGLVHYPGGNATDPIWRVLVSSLGISSWTPLKPQHSNPNLSPNPLANQLWCIHFLTLLIPFIISHRLPAFLEYLMSLKKLMLDSCKMVKKQSEAFHRFLWHFFPV